MTDSKFTFIDEVYEDEMFRAIFVKFLKRIPQNIDAILTSQKEQNWNELERLTHSLKSSSGSFGLIDTMNMCAGIEQLLESKDTETACEKIPELVGHFNEVLEFCKSDPLFADMLNGND